MKVKKISKLRYMYLKAAKFIKAKLNPAPKATLAIINNRHHMYSREYAPPFNNKIWE